MISVVPPLSLRRLGVLTVGDLALEPPADESSCRGEEVIHPCARIGDQLGQALGLGGEQLDTLVQGVAGQEIRGPSGSAPRP